MYTASGLDDGPHDLVVTNMDTATIDFDYALAYSNNDPSSSGSDPASSPTAGSTAAPSGEVTSKTNIAAIAGGAAGGAVAVLLLAGLSWWFWRRRKSRRAEYSTPLIDLTGTEVKPYTALIAAEYPGECATLLASDDWATAQRLDPALASSMHPVVHMATGSSTDTIDGIRVQDTESGSAGTVEATTKASPNLASRRGTTHMTGTIRGEAGTGETERLGSGWGTVDEDQTVLDTLPPYSDERGAGRGDRQTATGPGP